MAARPPLRSAQGPRNACRMQTNAEARQERGGGAARRERRIFWIFALREQDAFDPDLQAYEMRRRPLEGHSSEGAESELTLLVSPDGMRAAEQAVEADVVRAALSRERGKGARDQESQRAAEQPRGEGGGHWICQGTGARPGQANPRTSARSHRLVGRSDLAAGHGGRANIFEARHLFVHSAAGDESPHLEIGDQGPQRVLERRRLVLLDEEVRTPHAGPYPANGARASGQRLPNSTDAPTRPITTVVPAKCSRRVCGLACSCT